MFEARNERQKFVKLDASGGINDLLSQTLDDALESPFGRYAFELTVADHLIQKVIGNPREVFFGTIDDKKILKERSANGDEGPPAINYAVQVGNMIETLDARASYGHFVQLVAHHLGIADTEEIMHSIKQSLKRTYGRVARAEINSDWTLEGYNSVGIRDSDWINIYLIPNRKPEYTKQWITDNETKVQKAVKPKRLLNALNTGAKSNYRIDLTSVYQGDSFDICGTDKVTEIIAAAGWVEVTDQPTFEFLRETPSNPDRVYRHPESPADYPFLGFETSESNQRRGQEVLLYAVVSPELQQKFHREFMAKFKRAVGVVIDAKFASVIAGEIDLSPAGLVLLTLKQMDHDLPSYDFHQQLPILSEIVVNVLIKTFTERDQFTDIAQHLQQMSDLNHSGEMVSGQVINLGWWPEKVKLKLQLQPA